MRRSGKIQVEGFEALNTPSSSNGRLQINLKVNISQLSGRTRDENPAVILRDVARLDSPSLIGHILPFSFVMVVTRLRPRTR
jgi:hypothetical protein